MRHPELAYAHEEIVESPEGRPLRIVSETPERRKRLPGSADRCEAPRG